ncbi:hypothetical protein [Demequina litorisediminis]|nr:hypothetical protein [Demequina litorisediminis]
MSETVPVRARGARNPWWLSWPVIVVGFMLCLLPGLILLWLRRGPRLIAKVIATAVVIAFYALAAVAGAPERTNPALTSPAGPSAPRLRPRRRHRPYPRAA